MIEQRRHTRLEDVLGAAREVSEALAALSTEIDRLRTDDPGFEAQRDRLRNAYNRERDRLAAVHDRMRPAVLGRYTTYRERVGFFPGRLDAMPGFKPERVLENYRGVIRSARDRARSTAAFLEECHQCYERANPVSRLLWRMGWTSPGYSLYSHRKPVTVGLLVVVVIAACAVAFGVLFTRGGSVEASTPNSGTGSVATSVPARTSPTAAGGTVTSVAAGASSSTTGTSQEGAQSAVGAVAPVDIAGDAREAAIMQLVQAGVVQLKPDAEGRAYFRPGQQVERGEMLRWLDRVQPIPTSDQAPPSGLYSDLEEPLKTKAVAAYQSRIVLEWPVEGKDTLFYAARPVSAKDASEWCARMLVRLIPATSLAEDLGISEAKAGDYRQNISTLDRAQLDLIVGTFHLAPAAGFAADGSVTRSEAAEILVNLRSALERHLKQ